MQETIAISLIEPNPFQSRKVIDKAQVARLAKEIGEVGFWDEAFRVRAVNGNYQLVVGHQRLEALKSLGHKKVAVDVVKLDDAAMAEQSLIENVQRDNLPEMDKAEAIARLVRMVMQGGAGETAAIERIGTRLGYSRRTMREFLAMTELAPETKQAMRTSNTSRHIARTAQHLGGDRLVRRVAQVPDPVTGRKLSALDLDEIQKAVAVLPEPRRKKIVKKLTSGEVHTVAEVKKLARAEETKLAKKTEIPPDLMLFIRKWTGDLYMWSRRLEAASHHKAYIHEHQEVVAEFKEAAETFMAALKDLLKL
jgi:ParB/RepB/Spo0J family partition protein